MGCAHQNVIICVSRKSITYKVNAKTRIEANSHQATGMTEILQHVCRKHAIFVSITSSMQAEKFQRKRKDLIDTSGYVRKCFFFIVFIHTSDIKISVNKLERITQCKYSLCVWCAHTIMVCAHQKLI